MDPKAKNLNSPFCGVMASMWRWHTKFSVYYHGMFIIKVITNTKRQELMCSNKYWLKEFLLGILYVIVVRFTEIDKTYYHPLSTMTVFNMQQTMRNAGKIWEMGNSQAFVLLLTCIVFALVLLRVVNIFMDHRHPLVLSPVDGKVRSKIIKYDNFELKQMRSECNKVGSLAILHPSILMKIISFKIPSRRKRGSHGDITREHNLNIWHSNWPTN